MQHRHLWCRDKQDGEKSRTPALTQLEGVMARWENDFQTLTGTAIGAENT